MMPLINQNRSIVIACDVDNIHAYQTLVCETADIEKIGGYKIGFGLALRYGLPKVVAIARQYTQKPIIYDHQKAGTDIPETGDLFMRVCADAGVSAVILLCQSGPATEMAWIEAAHKYRLPVIVGGLMSHPKYLRSEGGFIDDAATMEVYRIAADLGVTDFVVPGTRPNDIEAIYETLRLKNITPSFYSPGFGTQGGKISKIKIPATVPFHPIIGRSIVSAKNIREAALRMVQAL